MSTPVIEIASVALLERELPNHPATKFTGMNPSFDEPGRIGPGDWLLTWLVPARWAGWWWVAVVHYGGVMHAYRAPHPTEYVANVLDGRGVRQCSFKGKPYQPADGDPFEPKPKNRGNDQRTVYFIAGGGYVKIGVAEHVRSRLGSLQTGSPVPLAVLATVSGGGAALESDLHERFAASRRHGEWFELTPDLQQYIAEVGA